MTKTVTIIDYGLGNLFSVSKAFEHVGAQVEITADPEKILNADYLVLPGVGAFNKGMQELASRNLIEPIKKYAASGKPLMGICLGMQMLFETGEENGAHQGLGLIKGKVIQIPAEKIPHIGWGVVDAKQPWLGSGKEFYFVHSYHAQCANSENLLGTVNYENIEVTASVKTGNVIGYQFHPEKSRSQGLDLCKSFLEG
jgi:glutamine amidotransferase